MNYILICDDVIDNCLILQFFLEIEGYKVEFVTSGIEAINQARLQKPELLLLDVMMPVLSGFEVVKLLREDKNLENLPILLITAYKELSQLDLTNIQVSGVIHKPVDPDVLLKKVQEVL